MPQRFLLSYLKYNFNQTFMFSLAIILKNKSNVRMKKKKIYGVNFKAL